ncbi:MAG: hypothetical protein AB9856_14095 [Cellulosilyticaceae bacterium]
MEPRTKNNADGQYPKKKKKRNKNVQKNKGEGNRPVAEPQQKEKVSNNYYNKIETNTTIPTLNQETLRNAVILSEILGAPVCRRRGRHRVGR